MKQEQGFTLVEVTLVASLLAMVMAAVTSCLFTATESIHRDDRVAVSMEALQRSVVRVSQIMRPCSISSYRVMSVAGDVPLYANTAGEWMEPIDGDPRPQIQFQAASGTLSLNANDLTDPRTLRLQLENGETDNDVDDDGDGLIDESRLILEYDGIPVAIASGIESATFTLTGRLLEIELKSAARARDGSVQRFTAKEVLYMRNN